MAVRVGTRLQCLFNAAVRGEYGLSLRQFVLNRLDTGATINEVAADLKKLTGRSVAGGTVYRWAKMWREQE